MKSPFKFLDSFTKDDRDIFFGRDREIEELYQRVFESKLLLVYGVSGTGKSSLIHCGLANKFRETDWLPIVLRRGGNIIESMAAGIRNASLTEQLSRFATPGDFKKGARSLYLDHYKPVFFLFDQFEELFIFGDKEERRSFIHIVKTLTESDLQCRMIFVMREEYMAWVTEFERVIPSFFANRVRIEKMSHRNALDAIKGPCNAFNISLEEGFAETLLEKLSPGSEDVELTYLQVFLDKIFRLASEEKKEIRDQGQVSFTMPLLQKTGNVSDLLGSFLDDQISLMENPETAMNVLKAFVSGKGTKRPANEQEAIDNIRSFGKNIPPEKVKELIQSFVKLRVLRDKDDHGRYELRHDALAEKVYEKFSTAEKELLEIRQYIENSYQSYLKRKILLSTDDLIYISNKDSLLNLNADLQEFMEKSRKHQKAVIRTLRRLTVISAVVFLLLVAIVTHYISDKMKVVNSNYEAVESLSETRNLRERLALAASAWEKNNGILPKEALLNAFNSILNSEDKDTSIKINPSQYKILFEPSAVQIQYAECSKDNKYILGFGDSLILEWESTGLLYKSINTTYPVIDLKISGDSRYFGAVTSDSILTIYNILGIKKFSYKIRYNALNTKQIFRFTESSDVLSLSRDYDAVLLNTDGYVLQTFKRHKGSVNAVNLSNDNNFIATASSDKTINIWYLNSVGKRYDFYETLSWHTDTVWSVAFSKSNTFVISTSADSTVRIGSINNLVVNRDFFFPRDRKYCLAEFSKSDRGLIAYYYNQAGNERDKGILASHADNPTYDLMVENGFLLKGLDGTNFQYFIFSPDENCFIYTQINRTFLSDTKIAFGSSIFNLMELTGQGQSFTSDGKYILSINGNTFRTYFIDVKEIYHTMR